MEYPEFPYKYIIFRQTPDNYKLLAGWALQYPNAMQRGLYNAKMYFKKTVNQEFDEEGNPAQNDLIILGIIHPVDSQMFRMIKIDKYDFDTLLPMFEELQDKEYLDAKDILGEIDEEGNYYNYLLDHYYTSLVVDSSNEEIAFYDYILNRNK